jgi:hypothetical protein
MTTFFDNKGGTLPDPLSSDVGRPEKPDVVAGDGNRGDAPGTDTVESPVM